jgi:two-component system alkaline phosphatase synthesis response regulator PhoP
MNTHISTPTEESVSAFLTGQSFSRQRVLVVEQEGDMRQLNPEILTDAGYQVDVAEDGAAAWDALQLHSYDLLITDQFLPKVSGVELLKKMHVARMAVPVIMATQILPTWEFALHPCLQRVTMLHMPYTIEKLLGMVKSILPETANTAAQILPAPTGPTASAIISFATTL